MTTKEAIDLFESLVQANLGAGAFKNFETLDRCRAAIARLRMETELKKELNGEVKKEKTTEQA